MCRYRCDNARNSWDASRAIRLHWLIDQLTNVGQQACSTSHIPTRPCQYTPRSARACACLCTVDEIPLPMPCANACARAFAH